MLLLLLASEALTEEFSPAQMVVAIPPGGIDFTVDGVNKNHHVRFITGFEITWSLGNSAHLKCTTIDPYVEDPEDAYRVERDQEVIVKTKTGITLFKGEVIDARERALQEPNAYTVVEIDAIDMSEPLQHRHITASFGGDENPVAVAVPENPVRIQTRDPHGLVNGDTVMIRNIVYGPANTSHPVNGIRAVTVVDPYTFRVNNINASGLSAGVSGTISLMLQLRTIINGLSAVLGEYGIEIDTEMEPGPWMERVTFNDMTVADILRYLTSVTGWPHRILPEGKLQFFPAGSIEADFTLDKTAVDSGLRIQSQRLGLANKVIVRYGSALTAERTEQFVGNGSNRVFPLRYKPSSGSTSVSPGHVFDHRAGMNGAARHVGVWGIDTLHEFVYRYSDNALVQLNVFAGVTSVPVPVGQVIEFTFPVQFPQTLSYPDSPVGPVREAKFEAPEIFYYEAARQFAQGKFAESNDRPRRASVPTTAGLVWPGAVFEVDLPHRLMTGTWLVTEVRLTQRKDHTLEYVYSLIEGTVNAPGWRERIRELFGGGGSKSITGGSPGTPAPALPPGQAGVGGSGTIGRVPLWIEPTVLADSPIFLNPSGAVEVEAELVARQNITALANITADGSISADLDLIATRAVWTPLVRSNGNIALQPSNDVLLDPGSNIVASVLPYDVNLGALNRKFLTVHAAELWVETLVAHETMATIGGRILVAPTTHLVIDLNSSATQIRTKHNSLFNGEVVRMEANNQIEFMRITSNPSGGAGNWTYNVTRNLDGTGSNNWSAGDAVVSTGNVGNGWMDLYSIHSMRADSEVGPTIVGNVRTGTAFNAWSPRWAIGSLKGLYGFTATTYGAVFGDPNQAWIKIDEKRIVMGNGNAAPPWGGWRVWIEDGNAWFTGNVTATSGAIGGWTIIDQYLYAGSTSTARAGMRSVDIPTAVAFWAGNFDENAAPFRVLHNGTLFASNATISGNGAGMTNISGGNITTGSITATQIAAGTITGDKIAANTITAAKLSVTTLSAISANMGTVTAGTINGATIVAGKVTISSSGIDIDASGADSSHNIEWSNGSVVMSRNDVASLHMRGPGGGQWSQINLYSDQCAIWGGTGGGGRAALEIFYSLVRPGGSGEVALGQDGRKFSELHLSNGIKVSGWAHGYNRTVYVNVNGELFPGDS